MFRAYSMKGIFWFRRDLRLDDNTGLARAAQECDEVIPVFIFNPVQVGPLNKYRSHAAVQFMVESLMDLEQHIRKIGGVLNIYMGSPEVVLKDLAHASRAGAVYVNNDYTPFSRARDAKVARVVDLHGSEDVLLYPIRDERQAPAAVRDKPYLVFSAMYNKASKLNIPKPKTFRGKLSSKSYETKHSYSLSQAKGLYTTNPNLYVHGGRSSGAGLLKQSIKTQSKYGSTRDFPRVHTSQLSAHIKFGTLSIREVYHTWARKFGKGSPLVRQLFWRDFYTHIVWHKPELIAKSQSLRYQSIKWTNDPKAFKRWCTGTTGFPLVDAGMRQLNATGWMHNRVRMVVSQFLSKDLWLDWRLGERYFATMLVDFDVVMNSQNWQWNAGVGADRSPYGVRIFNPWIQSAKFDPMCEYIKTWVPELKDVPPRDIHNWSATHGKYQGLGYPSPVVDHASAARFAKSRFSKSG